MPLVSISDLSIRYRGPALLDGVNCLIDAGERIGLLGRNGAGKTTFLKMISGSVVPDSGRIDFASGAKVALLPQDIPQDIVGSVHEVVRSGMQTSPMHAIDDADEWRRDHAVEQILTRMELDANDRFERMSSGMKRRVLLARALVDEPQLLLLDEPTNHLDIPAIEWLENFLNRWSQAYMFITHDRQFLRKLATRILEIEGGKLYDWVCDYDTFLRRKDEALAAEEKQNALFDKKLAQEEAWIRQGIKARRTRNEGRVRALKELRRVRSERRSAVGSVNLQIQEATRSGNLVLSATDLQYEIDGKVILDGFSTTLMRGDKVGIIGRNGAGKTTLLRILLGKLQPQAGNIRVGTNVEIAYFDQLRAQLDENKTVQDDVADGYQTVKINGKAQHIIGYLQDFLFTPERARTPIKLLSGGERNRVLLAKLFTKPANLIVLDEPTNDLDAETLELLEDRLVQYEGTLLVVSHDREFLNNVVTSSIVFEDGGVREYVGGYDDWLRQSQSSTAAKEISKASVKPKEAEVAKTSTKTKLSFKEQRELEQLPTKIEQTECEIAAFHEQMSAPEFYKQSTEAILAVQNKLTTLESSLAEHYLRWEELSERQ